MKISPDGFIENFKALQYMKQVRKHGYTTTDCRSTQHTAMVVWSVDLVDTWFADVERYNTMIFNEVRCFGLAIIKAVVTQFPHRKILGMFAKVLNIQKTDIINERLKIAIKCVHNHVCTKFEVFNMNIVTFE